MLFLLNLCYCLPSTLALIQPMAMTARPTVRQNSKPRLKVYGYAMPMSMTTPGIDYGLYDYDMSVIYYNTVTM